MLNVLMIEDNSCDAFILERACEEVGFTGKFTVASDGARARRILHELDADGEQRLPHIIVLDLGLPGLSGHEVLNEIRKNARTMQLPVIVFTSSDDPSDSVTALQNGASLFVTKPFDLDGYRQIAKRFVSQEFPRLVKEGGS